MNYSKLTDLDELALTVRDRDSRLYINEAINAYRGSAYRSAIISTWIAVITDIISKIRELALQGDSNANSQITLLESAILSKNISQLQKIENELLGKAHNDFEFLSSQEFGDLQRLKEDRNYCAHPAFVGEGTLFQPQPEMVRAHIVHSILYLLQHQPVQGKSASNRVKADIARSSFPADLENVIKLLGAKYLNRAKDSFVRNLVIGILKNYLKDDDVELINRDQALIHTLIAVSHHNLLIYEETLREKLNSIINSLNDKQLAKIFKLISADVRYWVLLNDSNKIRITSLLNTLTTPELIEYRIFDAIQVLEFQEFISEKFKGLEYIEPVCNYFTPTAARVT
ncbi:MAG: hypothetical protein WKF90_12315 [Pyrinomonadaceae bacterium]